MRSGQGGPCRRRSGCEKRRQADASGSRLGPAGCVYFDPRGERERESRGRAEQTKQTETGRRSKECGRWESTTNIYRARAVQLDQTGRCGSYEQRRQGERKKKKKRPQHIDALRLLTNALGRLFLRLAVGGDTALRSRAGSAACDVQTSRNVDGSVVLLSSSLLRSPGVCWGSVSVSWVVCHGAVEAAVMVLWACPCERSLIS
ncbi:hypothetical protein VTN02DRAFT_5716 [Thermoascus thermophilus]